MLQVGKSTNKYVGGQWHLVKKKYWGGATSQHVVSMMVQYFCETEPVDRTPRKFHGMEFAPYDKDLHRKTLCENCIKVAKSYNKGGGEQAKPSHS